MGDMKLWLVLLLGTCTFALARRYKSFRRYVYQYEAETQNSVNTPLSLRSGPKITCKVEIDVPRACSFVLNMSGCSLSEVVDMDAEGFPVYGPAAETQAFQAAMEKNTLKVMVEGKNSVQLFPEKDETINILNIKRGIVSALLVPDMEMEKKKNMATIHGTCVTDLRVNNREDIATDVTITRDLSGCDGFSAQRDYGSPVALISGMHYPLSRLISSTQICNYRFDNQKKHMTLATCTEKHVYLPFSHRNEYGISSIVKQVLTLHGTNKINDRVFHYNKANLKNLPMEATEEKAPVQSTDALLTVFKELRTIHQNQQGHQRASIFYKLVSELRRLESAVLKQAITQMVEEDQFLTWQSLIQCGTPECSSTMLQILRGFSSETIEIDASIYALAMVHRPSDRLVRDILEMAKNKQSKPIMFALSNVVRNKVTPAITAVHNYVSSILGPDCAGDKELTYLILRVVGNMGKAMEAANPNIKSILLKCMRQPATTLSVQIAAIQAFRYMSVTDEVRHSFTKRVAQYSKGAVQKRLAAYLLLMRNPEVSDLELVKKILKQEQNMQVRSFVSSHIYNIVQSKDQETQKLAEKIIEVMQDKEVINLLGYTKLSGNYKIEAYISQLPKEVMLETTLKVFGYSFDVWEFGMEGKGFDPSIEAIFGKNGFFPDTISKAMYWVGDKMPNPLNEVLQQWMEPLRTNKTKRQVSEDILKETVYNFNKLVKDLRDHESPEAMAYLRIMGAELGYIKGNGDLSAFASRMIMMELMSGKQNIFAHYIFMDNQFHLPTASGLPLRFTLSGTFTPSLKGGLHMEQSTRDLTFSPSMGVEFVTRMGVHVPKFVASAVEMHTNFYHESSLNAKISMAHGQIKLTIPAPKGTTQLLSARLVICCKLIMHFIMKCSPLFTGVKYCTTVRYTAARSNEAAPYFPLNGETKIAVDIRPTDAVTEYMATFSYELLNEGIDGRQKSDSLRMILRSDGKYTLKHLFEAIIINIPDCDVEAGIRVGITDSSAKGKKLTIDISNKNIPQVSLVGCEKKDGLLQAQVIVPSLKTEAALTATIMRTEDLTLELKSNITVLETSSIQSIVFKYESTFKYQFNKDHITTTISLPLGGTTSEDLRIPHAMATPDLSMPQIGLTVSSKQFRLPTFSIPSSYDFTLPLLGMAQMSTKISTNFYNFEAMISGGNNTVEGPSYIANYKFIANSSMEILTSGRLPDALKITFNSSLSHKLIDAHFSLLDSVTVMRDAVKGTGNYKMQVFSPLGMKMSMVYTSQTTLYSDITGEGNMEGHLTVGPVSASASLTQFFVLQPSIREARAESSFRVSSSIVQICNKIKAAVTSEELSFESNTNINNDPLKHTTKFNIDFKKAHFTFKSDVTKADKRMIRNQVDFSATMEEASRLTSTELYLNSMYIGDVFNSSAKNTIAVDVSSFTASLQVNGDLKILGAHFINDAQVKAEPHKIELTGTLKRAFAEEELRHTYEIRYADLAVTTKCSTTGKFLGTQMTQSFEAEIIGLSLKLNNEFYLKSPSLYPVSNIFAVVESFLFSDGELDVYRKHSGQMKGKLLVSVQPLSFSLEHECKASTSHQLGNGNSIETIFLNEITGAFALERQSFNVKMRSKLNEHAFDQVLEFYNTLENLGFELRGTVLTNLLNKVNKDQEEFSIFGGLQYEKNSDSHFISLPFTENLPKLREQIKTSLYSLKDHCIKLLQDSNGKYNVGANIRSRASELKQIFESFDVNVFFEDVENAILFIEVEKYVNKLSTVVSSEEITKSYIFVREMIETVAKKNYISSKINEIYAKVEEIVAEYGIEPLVEKSVDNAVELMKKYNLKETMQLAISHLKSVNIKPLFDQCSRHVNELAQQLDSLDFRHMTDELSDYVDRFLQKLTSFDTFADEAREKVLEMTRVLCFGKLYSEFEINSPDHKMKTTARLENSTNSETSQFIAILNSQFDTPIGPLAYSFNSAAQFVVPKIRHISILATVSVHHMAFSFDHQGSLAVHDVSSQASSKTTVKATTELYTAELVNSVAFAVKSGFSGTMDTSYEHNLNMPLANMFSEAALTQKSTVQMKVDIITLALKHEGRGKCSLFDYLHEGTHKSDMEFVMDIQSTKLMFSGDTDSNLLKMKQNLNIESGHFRYFTITAHVQTDTPFIKRSVAVMKGQIQIQDPKIELTVSHNAELVDKIDGIMYNSLNIKAVPFEIAFDTKNKNNIKLVLPFKLYGMVDLQNDLIFNLNATAQQASWTGLARFNQYKYSHYINMVNVEKEIQVIASVNGEANLDILTLPIEIPELMVPFIRLKTPPIHSISLWEDTGLRKILISPHQLFDMDTKWKYIKSPKVVALDINMEQLFNAVNRNTRVLCKNLLIAAETLSTIFNHTRALSQLALIKITLPKIPKTIRIPAMGDLIYEFSVKTTIITLNTKVSILNQDDIVTQFEAQSTSEFDVFNATLTGATIFNRDRMKLTTKMSLVHMNLECIHNGLLVLSTDISESSIGNVAKVKLPNVNVDLYQKVTGTVEEGISISASTPSAGLIGLQLKSKSPSYIIGRLYSRYLSDFQNDVDILKVTIILVDSEKLNFQTQWNMEVPIEMLCELKERVSAVIYSLDLTNHMDTISTELDKVYSRVESTIAHIKDEGKVMYRRATEKQMKD
uniref:Vitellogenin domain-containing protein n=1 Tax=Pygocentrus nattereri TaxID=42514 RepID=A0A3B4DG37_PYGNA